PYSFYHFLYNDRTGRPLVEDDRLSSLIRLRQIILLIPIGIADKTEDIFVDLLNPPVVTVVTDDDDSRDLTAAFRANRRKVRDDLVEYVVRPCKQASTPQGHGQLDEVHGLDELEVVHGADDDAVLLPLFTEETRDEFHSRTRPVDPVVDLV